MPSIADVCRRALAFQHDAHLILSRCEDAPSRVVVLDRTRRRVSGLSIKQGSLFREAIACIEAGCFRAAHVVAWAAFMDHLEERLASDGLKAIKAVRPSWAQYDDIVRLRESVTEHQLIEAAKDVGLLSKSEMKTLAGLLAKRHECAHPSDYNPDMNEAIGYVSELLGRVEALDRKSL